MPDGGSYEADNAPWPAELRVFQSEGRIEIDFTDGKQLSPAGRVSAGREPVGRGAGPWRAGDQEDRRRGRRHVKIAAVEPVGNYAIRIIFDDKHDTGIYSWSYLRELGDTYAERWAAYQAALLFNGLARPDSRDRRDAQR